jgi:hypothetical protein
MLEQKNIREILFQRLNNLQNLYCSGEIAQDSPEHWEILALEELESMFVRLQRQRFEHLERRLRSA